MSRKWCWLLRLGALLHKRNLALQLQANRNPFCPAAADAAAREPRPEPCVAMADRRRHRLTTIRTIRPLYALSTPLRPHLPLRRRSSLVYHHLLIYQSQYVHNTN